MDKNKKPEVGISLTFGDDGEAEVKEVFEWKPKCFSQHQCEHAEFATWEPEDSFETLCCAYAGERVFDIYRQTGKCPAGKWERTPKKE